MCNHSEWIVREAFLAYHQGEVTRMMDLVAPDLRWVCQTADGPQPQIRHGREQLEKALRRQADLGLRSEVEEVIAAGDHVMLVMRTPGLSEYRNGPGGDRTYDVVTVRDGLIAGLRGCRDRSEARSLAGIA